MGSLVFIDRVEVLFLTDPFMEYNVHFMVSFVNDRSIDR
jgi:hypothetical protein